MKRIYLDANVLIDFIDKTAQGHNSAVGCIKIIRKYFRKPFVSPATFLITDFIFSKFARNKAWHKQQMQLIFSGFELTAIQPGFIDAIFATHFTDLEDGLQYQCAKSVKADCILTKDLSDYFDSKIPVIHPNDFVSRYKELFG